MKIFLALALSFAMLFTPVPAKADNSEEVIIGILGGALGGLIIGEAIGSRNRPIYAVPPPPQPYYDPYVYEQPECVTRYFRKWDPYQDRYVKVRKVVCN